MFIAPTEATMGDVQRIFYYHLPSAWMAFLLFFVNFLASIWYLVRRSSAADALALACGRSRRLLLHHRAAHGTHLGASGLGHLVDLGCAAHQHARALAHLRQLSGAAPLRHRRTSPVLAAALGIFGFVDVPIVYMAIRWFRTQHPQPVIGGGEGSGLDPRMWVAVLWNLAAFAMLALMFVWVRYKQALAEQALEEAHAQASLDYETEDAQ